MLGGKGVGRAGTAGSDLKMPAQLYLGAHQPIIPAPARPQPVPATTTMSVNRREQAGQGRPG